MRIAIYHQNANGHTGGSEHVVAVIAELLSHEHQVTLVHHFPRLSRSDLEVSHGVDLSRVTLRYCERVDTLPASLTRPWQRLRGERRRYAEHLGGYDLVVASIHGVPPFCPAKRGALFIHFPDAPHLNLWPMKFDGLDLQKLARMAYARLEWWRRFRKYEVVMTNSTFTQRYTRDWWGLDSRVVYAPAGIAAPVVAKEQRILSVGRFSAGWGTRKSQLQLVHEFAELTKRTDADVRFQLIGGVSDNPADQAYLQRVVAAAKDLPVEVHPNVDRAFLQASYARAKLFWHAAGLESPDENPVEAEHFGIVTVEAMSAGCVPLVFARGGQPEIVEHGVSGYCWNTLEELARYSLELLHDPDLTARMSLAARARAEKFSVEAFRRRVEAALHPLLAP